MALPTTRSRRSAVLSTQSTDRATASPSWVPSTISSRWNSSSVPKIFHRLRQLNPLVFGDGNTRAVHGRSHPVPTDPVRSRMSWANDSAEQANCTVVPAGAPVFKSEIQWPTSCLRSQSPSDQSPDRRRLDCRRRPCRTRGPSYKTGHRTSPTRAGQRACPLRARPDGEPG